MCQGRAPPIECHTAHDGRPRTTDTPERSGMFIRRCLTPFRQSRRMPRRQKSFLVLVTALRCAAASHWSRCTPCCSGQGVRSTVKTLFSEILIPTGVATSRERCARRRTGYWRQVSWEAEGDATTDGRGRRHSRRSGRPPPWRAWWASRRQSLGSRCCASQRRWDAE